ncbi:MAG: hypothetical protein Q8K72_16620 [Acidimicrobiales bacterium]|nr:hypothetical protein [Acidimicrobiales bacterium]
MVSDQDRRELYEALERRLGGGPAATMMELLPPVGWADVARQSDLVAIRGEIAQLRGEIKAQLPRLYIANVAAMVGISGLVLAAAKLA